MTKRNERLNSNILAVSPSIEERNKIYKLELLSYGNKFMKRSDVFFTIGAVFLLMILSSSKRYYLFLATCIFSIIFFYKRIKKASIELSEEFKKGNFSDTRRLYENRNFSVFYLLMIYGFIFILYLFVSFLQGKATGILSVFFPLISSALCFIIAFFSKRIQKTTEETLDDIQKGDFKVIHTTVSKLESPSDETGHIICNLAGVSDPLQVYFHDVKVGSPVIIAFNNKNWRMVYTEYMLSEEDIENAVRNGTFP